MRIRSPNTFRAAGLVMAAVGLLVLSHSAAQQRGPSGEGMGPLGGAAPGAGSRPAASKPASAPASKPASAPAVAEDVEFPDKLTYKCEKCGHEFVKKLSELPQARSPAEQINSMLLDCPSCKEKSCCWQATKCPNCGKNFIAASMRANYDRLRTGGRGGPAQDPPDVCPNCKTNLNEWWREHSK